MKRLLIASAFAIALSSSAALAVDRICTPSNFASNFRAAAPGDRLILRSDAGTYGHYWLSNKHGNADNLIQIIAQNPASPPVFQTSDSEGLQIASCSYMLWDGIEVRGPTEEGIHLQGAGSGPSNHIIMRNVKVTMGSAVGNTDNWKCDDTSDVLFYNCTGNVNGDVAYDMMGCVGQLVMRSTSSGNTFAHAKNGSHDIGYYKNVFANTGERNFQFGGNGTYNYNQIAMGNVLYGASPQSAVFTTARYDEFRYNTIQNLTGGAIMRVLNEGSATPPTAYNTFANNLVQYNGSALAWPGGDTDPASFTVANNFWSKTPDFMGYMTQTGGVVGNPQLNAEFLPTNPAARDYGAHAPQMEAAWAAYTNRFAWAWSYAQQYEPRAEPGAYQAVSGSDVVLSGLGSYAGISPYGAYVISNYEWDLDFDGLFDDAVGTSVSLSPSQLAALGLGEGKHDIGLRVRITNEQGQYMYDEGWGTLTVIPDIDGDANRDGRVDYLDLGTLSGNYRMTSGAIWAMADFTGDGAVDYLDLGVLAANYRRGTTGGPSVPGPTALALLALGGLAMIRRRRRN